MWDQIKKAIEDAFEKRVHIVMWSLASPDDMLVIYASIAVSDDRLRVIQKTFNYREIEQMRMPERIIVDTVNQMVDTLLRKPEQPVMVEMLGAPYYTYPPSTVEGQHNG